MLQSGIDKQANRLTEDLSSVPMYSQDHELTEHSHFKKRLFPIFFSEKCLNYLEHLHAHKFEAFHLEPLDDLSNEAPLHTVGLDGNEGTLQFSHVSEIKQMGRMKVKYNQVDAAKETLPPPPPIYSRLSVAFGTVSCGAGCRGRRPHHT